MYNGYKKMFHKCYMCGSTREIKQYEKIVIDTGYYVLELEQKYLCGNCKKRGIVRCYEEELQGRKNEE